MKKIAFILLLTFIISSSLFAQTSKTLAFAKGNSMVSAGYGVGNIWRRFFEEFEGRITSVGPVALTYEYGVSKRISLGIGLGYSVVKNKITIDNNTANERLTNFSAIIVGNYHFFRSKRIDPYIGGGLGYYHFAYASDVGNLRDVTPDAVGISGQLGCKYYFLKNIGVYGEVGYVGGSLAQLGVTVKF